MTKSDIQEAMRKSKSSVGQDELEKCQQFGEQFGNGQTFTESKKKKSSASSSSSSSSASASGSDGGFVSFFKGLLGFGSSNGEDLPVAPMIVPAAAVLTSSGGGRRIVRASTEEEVMERKAVAM